MFIGLGINPVGQRVWRRKRTGWRRSKVLLSRSVFLYLHKVDARAVEFTQQKIHLKLYEQDQFTFCYKSVGRFPGKHWKTNHQNSRLKLTTRRNSISELHMPFAGLKNVFSLIIHLRKIHILGRPKRFFFIYFVVVAYQIDCLILNINLKYLWDCHFNVFIFNMFT